MRHNVWLTTFGLAVAASGPLAPASPLPISFAQPGTVSIAIQAKESAYSFKDVTLLLYRPELPYTAYRETLLWTDGMPGQPVYSFSYQAHDIIGFKTREEPSGLWLWTDLDLSPYSRMWLRYPSTWLVDLNDGSGGGFGSDAWSDDVDLAIGVHLTPIPEPATACLLSAVLLTGLVRPRRAWRCSGRR